MCSGHSSGRRTTCVCIATACIDLNALRRVLVAIGDMGLTLELIPDGVGNGAAMAVRIFDFFLFLRGSIC